MLRMDCTCKGCSISAKHGEEETYMTQCRCVNCGDEWISVYSRGHRAADAETCPNCLVSDIPMRCSVALQLAVEARLARSSVEGK